MASQHLIILHWKSYDISWKSDSGNYAHLTVCTTKAAFLKVSMATLLLEREEGVGLPSPLVTNSRITREILIAPNSNDIDI